MIAEEPESDHLSSRSILRHAGVSMLLLGAAIAVPAIRDPFLVAAAVVCVVRGRWALFALMIASVLVFLNPALAPGLGAGSVKWLVVLAAAIRALVQVRSTTARTRRIVLAILLHALIATLLALAVSRDVGLSLFKLLAFATGAPAVVVIASGRHGSWTAAVEALTGVTVAVCALSAFVLASPLGYAVNAVGFQGILNHPQGLGVFLAAPIAVWVGLIIAGARVPWIVLLVLPVAVFMTYLSEARTALLAVGLGVGASFALAVLHPARRLRALRGGSAVAVLVVAAALILQTLGISPVAAIDKFVSKRREGISLLAQYRASRGKTVEPSLDNFRKNPVAGIGFGIGHDLEAQRRNTTTIMGLPIGASTEKGNVATAVLEETGIVGMLSFLFLIGVMGWSIWVSGGIAAAALLLTILAVNLGEMTFFSLGGWGLYQWVLLGVATARSEQ